MLVWVVRVAMCHRPSARKWRLVGWGPTVVSPTCPSESMCDETLAVLYESLTRARRTPYAGWRISGKYSLICISRHSSYMLQAMTCMRCLHNLHELPHKRLLWEESERGVAEQVLPMKAVLSLGTGQQTQCMRPATGKKAIISLCATI